MYGLWLFKEIKTEYGYCKVEIYRKGYDGSQIEIGALASNSLTISLENLSEITAPIGKSVCSFAIIDTDQVDYDAFFTPDATAYKVVASSKVGSGAYITRWSGYITPDFFAENLTYRTPISISARDNIGYLNDVDFDLVQSTITIRELITKAFARIASDYPMRLEFVSQKQTAEGILAIDATISTALLKEMSWYEALETVLHDLGLQMRWVDNNTIAVMDLSQIPEYYTTQEFNFTHSSGYREILPAWRQLSQSQDYGLRENFFDGWIRSDNLTFVREEQVEGVYPIAGAPIKFYTPNNWGVAGTTFTINPNDFIFLGRETQPFGKRIYFTGTEKDSTNYASYMSYRQPVKTSRYPVKVSFKALNSFQLPNPTFSYFLNTFGPYHPTTAQFGLKVNLFLHSGVKTYILHQEWEEISTAETDAITFVFPEIGNGKTATEEECTINISSVPYDGDLEIRIYGYFLQQASNYTSVPLRGVSYISDVTYTYAESGASSGLNSGVVVSPLHNVKADRDYIFGQVPAENGGINAYAGGLYDASANMTELVGFQRNADGSNYNLLELVGREIIHFNKKNYNKLSGTIKNLDKEPLYFNKLFIREGKTYMPFSCSLNVISNEMNITIMQEVEPYVTESFTEINSEVVTGGGATVGSGNNTVLQYSEEAGNVKRVFELDTATEDQKKDAYLLIDSADFPEAKKVHTSDLFNDLGLSLVEQDGKIWLRSEYDFFSEGEVSSGGASDTEGEGGSGGSVVTVEQIVTDANGVPIAKINVDGVPNVIYAPRTAEVDLTGYATIDYVNTAIQNAKDTRVDTLINTTIPALESDIAKRALQSDLTALQTSHNALRNDFDALNTLLNDDVSEKIDTWNEVVDFLDEYSGSQDLATILSVMNADIAKRALQTSLDSTNANLNNHIDTFNTFVDATNNTLSSHNNRIKTFEDIIGIDDNGDVYIKKKADNTARNFYSYGEVSSGGLSDTGGSTGGGSNVSYTQNYTGGLLLGTLSIDGVTDGNGIYAPNNLSAYNNDAGFITSSAIPTALKNPYALSWSGYSSGNYDGSGTANIAIPTTLPASDVYAWAKKPSLAVADVPDLSGKYLPITGGTITNNSTHNPLIISTNALHPAGYGSTELAFLWNGYQRGAVGFTETHGGFVATPDIDGLSPWYYLGVKPDGTPYYCVTETFYPLIHSGNIGSQSVNYANSAGNADKVGGYTSDNIMLYSDAINANGNHHHAGYGYAAQGMSTSGPAMVFGSTNGYRLFLQALSSSHRLFVNYSSADTTKVNNSWRELAYLDSVLRLSGGTVRGNTAFDFTNGRVAIEENIAGMRALGFSFWRDSWLTGHIEAGTLNLNTLYKGQTNIGGGLSVKGGVDYCFTVGVGSDNRSYLELVTQSNNPCDLKLGADYDAYWSITARNIADRYPRALGFYSYKNNAYRMMITDDGHILIGTTTDYGSKLYVKSTTASQGAIAAFDSSYSNYGYNYTNMAIMFNGAVKGSWGWNNVPYSLGTQYDAGIFLLNNISGSGINIYDTGEILVRTSFMRTLGNFVADGEVTSGSDARYKRIESYAEIDIETIANAPIINFRWTDREDNKLHLGSTAQYWYNTSLLNGVIPTTDDKLWTMGYGQIALASVVSVAKKVVNHEERLQIVEKELADYKAENQMLKQLLNQYRYGIQ